MALCIWSLGTMHHRKTPSDCRKHSREYKLCVCVCVCVYMHARAHTHTQEGKGREGKAKPARPRCPGPHTTRLSAIRHPSPGRPALCPWLRDYSPY